VSADHICFFTCGRMNPPTIGHGALVAALTDAAAAEGGEAIVFLTRTKDRDKNPLPPETKKAFVDRAFGTSARLTTNPFSALGELMDQGARQLVFFVGEDRRDRFTALIDYAQRGGASLAIRSIPRPYGTSTASQARDLARSSDLLGFTLISPAPDPAFSADLFAAVRAGFAS